MKEFNRAVIEEFRANHGTMGGVFDGLPIVLLTTVGAKTGLKRVNPLAALLDDGRVYVIASKAGAPTHPDWYHNVLAKPEVEVELGDETFRAEAVPVAGAERDRLYALQVERVPGFGDYEKRTDRVIPVVELRRTA